MSFRPSYKRSKLLVTFDHRRRKLLSAIEVLHFLFEASFAARGWKFDSSNCMASIPSRGTSGFHLVIRLTEAIATGSGRTAPVVCEPAPLPAMRLTAPACPQAQS